jgi:hypothetical protein
VNSSPSSAIDYIMRESTEGKRNGIQWTMWQQLDDLDFADDIALISSALLILFFTSAAVPPSIFTMLPRYM